MSDAGSWSATTAAAAPSGRSPRSEPGHLCVAWTGIATLMQSLPRRAWGSTHVSRTTLKVCIRAIRIALGDHSEAPRYVETVGRQGYRFLIVGSAPPAQPNAADERTVVGGATVLAQLERWAVRAQQGARAEARSLVAEPTPAS